MIPFSQRRHISSLKYFFLLILILFINLKITISFCGVGEQSLFKIGGVEEDIPYSFLKTTDGFIVVGSTNSFGAGKEDVFFVKINFEGEVIWSKVYGWDEKDAGYAIINTNDGNFVIAGTSVLVDGIGEDVLLMKINANGDIIWKKEYGRSAWEWARDVIETTNNDLLVVGSTQDHAFLDYDYYIIRTDANGNMKWYKNYKLNGHNHAQSIIQSNDGNFIVVGTTSDITNINKDVFLMKINQDGGVIWTKQYGGEKDEEGYDVEYLGGGYVIIGSTSSFGEGRTDVYVVKISENGDMLWNKTYGTPLDDAGYHVSINNDKILIAGTTFDTDGNSADIYFLILDGNGKLLFSDTYGTENYDTGASLIESGPNIWLLGRIGTQKGDFGIFELSLEKTILDIQSLYDEPFGGGEYYKNTVTSFGLKSEIINISKGIRHVFDGWKSNSVGGYNGYNNPVEVVMKNDIVQQAIWKKQYYLEINTTSGGTITPASGWYDQGTQIEIQATPINNQSFIKWKGIGPGSYSGAQPNVRITINNPISQNANFGKLSYWNLSLQSEYGSTLGAGTYLNNTIARISVGLTVHQVNTNVRKLFTGWQKEEEDTIFSHNQQESILITSNVKITALWKTQYLVTVSAGNSGGSTTGDGWYNEGDAAVFSAIPYEGYEVSSWRGSDGSYREAVNTITIKVTSPIIQSVIFKQTPKPTNLPYYIAGAAVSLPLLYGVIINIQYNSAFNTIIKNEYNSSRGTKHKKILEKRIKKLEQKISQLNKDKNNLNAQMRSLINEKDSELKKAATQYIFNGDFDQIPGIGRVLKERIRARVFDGTLKSLNRASIVSGIGENKAYEIRSWVARKENQMPSILKGSFPQKREITSRYDGQIRKINLETSQIEDKLNELVKLEHISKQTFNELKSVTEKTFRASHKDDKEASKNVTTYYEGAYPEWLQPPQWYKKLTEEFS
jgi:hypothetical protein